MVSWCSPWVPTAPGLAVEKAMKMSPSRHRSSCHRGLTERDFLGDALKLCGDEWSVGGEDDDDGADVLLARQCAREFRGPH